MPLTSGPSEWTHSQCALLTCFSVWSVLLSSHVDQSTLAILVISLYVSDRNLWKFKGCPANSKHILSKVKNCENILCQNFWQNVPTSNVILVSVKMLRTSEFGPETVHLLRGAVFHREELLWHEVWHPGKIINSAIYYDFMSGYENSRVIHTIIWSFSSFHILTMYFPILFHSLKEANFHVLFCMKTRYRIIYKT